MSEQVSFPVEKIQPPAIRTYPYFPLVIFAERQHRFKTEAVLIAVTLGIQSKLAQTPVKNIYGAVIITDPDDILIVAVNRVYLIMLILDLSSGSFCR